jgi:hypothetical protein
MPDAPEDPIAYTALQPGTPVQTNEGLQFATVQAVLVDDKVSVSDGIVVETAEGTRFVDAPLIGAIYSTHVRTTLSADQAANLPLPAGSNLIEIKPARSVAERLGRMFGRGKR